MSCIVAPTGFSIFLVVDLVRRTPAAHRVSDLGTCARIRVLGLRVQGESWQSTNQVIHRRQGGPNCLEIFRVFVSKSLTIYLRVLKSFRVFFIGLYRYFLNR